MNIASNNNIAFRSDNRVEKIASLNDSDIDKASKILAYQDYKKRSDKTKALGIGLLATYPVLDSVATSAALKGTAMSTRAKAGLKNAGSWGVMIAATLGIFKLVNKTVEKSPKVREFVNNNPGTFLAGELAGVFGILYAGQKLLPTQIKKLAEIVTPKAQELAKKLDKFELIDKTENGYNTLKSKSKELINKLNGGRVESALDRVGDLLVKEGKETKTGTVLAFSLGAVVLGLITKQVYDAAKFGKETKKNNEQLTALRSQAQEMAAMQELTAAQEMTATNDEDLM